MSNINKVKAFALLSLFSLEHSDDDVPDWIKYEYLDPNEKKVIGSEKEWEAFKEFLSDFS